MPDLPDPALNDAADIGAEALPIADAIRPRRFARTELATELPDDLRVKLVEETHSFLNRRFEKLAVDFDDIAKTNFNPFLLLITAPVYNLFSPFEIAQRLQLGKAYHGDDTAFGRLAEEKFLKIFGASTPPEKEHPVNAAARARWSAIDLEVIVEGNRYLMSIKAGPWTMNQAHANEMVRHFRDLHEQTGARILIGITYGRYKNLNNKPAYVDRALEHPDWFEFLAGKDLWEFVSGVEDVHKHMFGAIREGQKRFAAEHADMTFHEHLIANALKISTSLRRQFNVVDDEDFWGTLFNAMFESRAGLPGEPNNLPPIIDPAGTEWPET